MSTLDSLLLRFRAARATLKEVEELKAEDQEAVIKAYRKGRISTHEVELPDEGVIVKGTLVEGSEVRIDLDSLWDELTPAQRKKVSAIVIDKELLEAAVVQGDIDAKLVEKHSEVYHKAPYVKITERVLKPPAPARRKKVRR